MSQRVQSGVSVPTSGPASDDDHKVIGISAISHRRFPLPVLANRDGALLAVGFRDIDTPLRLRLITPGQQFGADALQCLRKISLHDLLVLHFTDYQRFSPLCGQLIHRTSLSNCGLVTRSWALRMRYTLDSEIKYSWLSVRCQASSHGISSGCSKATSTTRARTESGILFQSWRVVRLWFCSPSAPLRSF